MERPFPGGALARFLLGTGASALAGLVLFGSEMLDPDALWFQCLSVGALLAGVIALLRVGRAGQALSLSTAFALVQVGYAWTLPPARALAETAWGIVLGGGVFAAALVFHRLAQHGFPFGKFVLLGPLVAGVYLAATAVILVTHRRGTDALGLIVQYVLVGLVVGDAVGLGVELAEMLPGIRAASPPDPRAA